ncbi:MAG TPA: response regulator [Gammaproteobacteria bacterium]|jgi:two-component system KDP operon response regulator KdpE|nr:response regulator [Gammaproteobacteria bacterium]
MPPIRILVIDDEVQIRRFLRISLASEGYEVLEAATADEGLKLAATQGPDLVVLDLGLRGADGKDVLREIRVWSKVPVIILSVRADENEKVRALDAGANDYVIKPFGLQEFLARVRNLLRSLVPDDTGSVHYDDGYLRIDIPQRRVVVSGNEVRLTRKEFAVLKTLLTNRDRVVTQTHLLREIWGPTHEADTHYLRIIVARLRNKLADDPTDPRYLQTEAGVGYRFVSSALPTGDPDSFARSSSPTRAD